MSIVIFESVAGYLESCKTLNERIAAIDAIIDRLLITAATAAETGQFDEYWFDDGHVKIRNKYRSVSQVEQSIVSFQRLRELYVNKKMGRMTRLMDASNFIGRC